MASEGTGFWVALPEHPTGLSRTGRVWTRLLRLEMTNATLADNPIGVTLVNHDSVVRDSLIVGESANRGTRAVRGQGGRRPQPAPALGGELPDPRVRVLRRPQRHRAGPLRGVHAQRPAVTANGSAGPAGITLTRADGTATVLRGIGERGAANAHHATLPSGQSFALDFEGGTPRALNLVMTSFNPSDPAGSAARWVKLSIPWPHGTPKVTRHGQAYPSRWPAAPSS